MATLPTSPISLNDIQNAFGGSNPIGLNEYYRGGSYVDAYQSSTIPTSGTISLDNFRGVSTVSLAYYTIGDTTNGLTYGAHTTSGGNAGGSLNNYYYSYTAVDGYGRPYTASGVSGQNGGFWLSNGTTKIAQVTTGSLYQTWYPFVPTLYGANGAGSTNIGGRSVYATGTCDVSPVAASDTTFMWRHPSSSWSDTMVTNFLGFNSSHLSKSKRAVRVWWNYALAGMDSDMRGGFMIFSASTYNASGAQACYNGATKMYLHKVNDAGGEWQQQGWQFAPTVSGITVTNTGTTTTTSYTYDSYGRVTGSYTSTYLPALTWIGATGRSSNAVLGINEEANSNYRSDYTWSLTADHLVVPMMKSDNGFSGGAWNGARNPLVARFGYIGTS